METFIGIEELGNSLDELILNATYFYGNVYKLKGQNVDSSLIKKSKEYIVNENARFTRIQSAYGCFSREINTAIEKYIKEMNTIEKEDREELERLRIDFGAVRDEIIKGNEQINMRIRNIDPKTSIIYRDNVRSKMGIDLVINYPGSYVYREYISDRRSKNGEVFIDLNSENDEWIVKYMKNEKSLNEDLKKMNTEMKSKLLDDLSFLELPIKKNAIMQIGRNEDNEIMEAWRNRRIVKVNGESSNEFNELLAKYNLLDFIFMNSPIRSLQYYAQSKLFCTDVKMNHFEIVKDYLRNGRVFNIESLKNHNINEIIREMELIGIILKENELNEIEKVNYQSIILSQSSIVDQVKYDKALKEWIGDYHMKLLYRASEHSFTAESFHKLCDDKGPTLTIIKSSDGWIFGGFTTQSWSGCIFIVFLSKVLGEYKGDAKAFIFTLKNPHGIAPTRLMKRKDCFEAIKCNPFYGPLFGNGFAICIRNNCNKEKSCSISSSNNSGYMCDLSFNPSMFVSTNTTEGDALFSVLDYEVYCIENYKEYIYKNCKYPEQVWSYIETKEISDDVLRTIDQEQDILNDLNSIDCIDHAALLKISKFFLKTPSQYLPGTQIVDKEYDVVLKQWISSYKRKLIYRASENEYSGKSFHECCDNKGSTLVVIKSTEGWIFGGYTTKSWSGDGIDNDIILQ